MKKIIAHKGGAYLYPENSRDAILQSYDDFTCDGTEIDVRMTKDRVLVIIHDIDTFRSGDKLKLIRNHTYDELKNILVRPHRIDWYLQYYENLTSRDSIHDRYNLQLLSSVKQKRSNLITLKEALMMLPQNHELVVEYKGANEDYDAYETYQRILFETIAPYSYKNVKAVINDTTYSIENENIESFDISEILNKINNYIKTSLNGGKADF